MSIEINWGIVAQRSGQCESALRDSERTSTTARMRRVGEFDWALIRRAALLNRPTDVALTFVDYLDKSDGDAKRFDQLTPQTIQFIEEVEAVCEAPVTLIANGFNSRSVIDRRRW
jgi:adenylosuccinate synthase